MIVCQKLPALEVVRKRLVAGNLGDRIVMITNVTSDRMPLLREIRNQLDTSGDADRERVRQLERKAITLQGRLNRLESEIDSRYEATYRTDPVSGCSYRQILGELIGLEGSGQSQLEDVVGLRPLLGELSLAVVTECEDACGSLADTWIAACFEDNPLEAARAFSHDDGCLAEFRSVLAEFVAAETATRSDPETT